VPTVYSFVKDASLLSMQSVQGRDFRSVCEREFGAFDNSTGNRVLDFLNKM